MTDQSVTFCLRNLLSDCTIAVLRLAFAKVPPSTRMIFFSFPTSVMAYCQPRHPVLLLCHGCNTQDSASVRIRSHEFYDERSTPLFLFRYWNYIHLDREKNIKSRKCVYPFYSKLIVDVEKVRKSCLDDESIHSPFGSHIQQDQFWNHRLARKEPASLSNKQYVRDLTA